MTARPATARHWTCPCGYTYLSPRPISRCEHRHHVSASVDRLVAMRPADPDPQLSLIEEVEA
jgi:hypothetical protein